MKTLDIYYLCLDPLPLPLPLRKLFSVRSIIVREHSPDPLPTWEHSPDPLPTWEHSSDPLLTISSDPLLTWEHSPRPPTDLGTFL